MKITFNTTAAGNDGIEVDAIKLTGKLLPEGITDPQKSVTMIMMKKGYDVR